MSLENLVLNRLDGDELAWQDQALCAQTDPELFFPEKGGSTRVPRQVCAACTVRTPCLEYALTIRDINGVWGGTTEQQRKRILAERDLDRACGVAA